MATAVAASAAAAAPPLDGFTTLSFWGTTLTVNPMACVLLLVIAVFCYGLWKGQRSNGANTFDVWDLVMDTLPPGTGAQAGDDLPRRASAIKLFFNGAFILSSWLVVDQEIKASPLLPSIFGIYMATWGAALIAKVVYDAKAIPDFNLPGGRRGGSGD